MQHLEVSGAVRRIYMYIYIYIYIYVVRQLRVNYDINEMVVIKSRAPQSTQLVLNVLIIEVKSNENLLL